MSNGTQIKVFSLENNDSTVVVATSDTSRPEVPARMQYEECENDAESTAVVQKFVFDLQRQGWTLEADTQDQV